MTIFEALYHMQLKFLTEIIYGILCFITNRKKNIYLWLSSLQS